MFPTFQSWWRALGEVNWIWKSLIPGSNYTHFFNSFRKGEQVNIHPINQNYSRIKFLDNENAKCVEEDPIGLLILVKSAPNYFDKRAGIVHSFE